MHFREGTFLIVPVQQSTVHVVHLHVHGLGLRVMLHGGVSVFPPDSGHLEAAKGNFRRCQIKGVDPARPSVNLRNDSMTSLQILRENTA